MLKKSLLMILISLSCTSVLTVPVYASQSCVSMRPPVVSPSGDGDDQDEEPGDEEPGTEDPGNMFPGHGGKGDEEPGTENPGNEDPDPSPTQVIPSQGLPAEEPSAEAPGQENPIQEEPGTEDPGIENPGDENPIIAIPSEEPIIDNPIIPGDDEDTVEDGEDSEDADDEESDEGEDSKSGISETAKIVIAALIGLLIIAVAVIIAMLSVGRNKNEKEPVKRKPNDSGDNNFKTIPINSGSPANVNTDIGSTVKVNATAFVKENASGGRPFTLDVKMGKVNGTSFTIGTRLGIGSDPSCDIVFSDATVEPVHAIIEVRNGELFLVDNSKSGTYLEGMRISVQNKLDSGDTVSLGNTEFVVRF